MCLVLSTNLGRPVVGIWMMSDDRRLRLSDDRRLRLSDNRRLRLRLYTWGANSRPSAPWSSVINLMALFDMETLKKYTSTEQQMILCLPSAVWVCGLESMCLMPSTEQQMVLCLPSAVWSWHLNVSCRSCLNCQWYITCAIAVDADLHRK